MTPRPRTAAVAAVAGLLSLAAGCGWFGDDDGERTRLTLAVTMPDGSPPTPDTLTATGETIADRFAEAGFPEPAIDTEGSRMVVTVREQVDHDRVRSLLVPGELQFRKVLASVDDPGGPAPASEPGPVPTWQEVAEKVGDDAVTAAEDWLAAVPDTPSEPPPEVAPFGELTGPEVAAVPTALQFYLPVIGCEQLADRPTDATQEPGDLVAACDDAMTTKYLLDVAQVERADLTAASAEQPPQTVEWVTLLDFTPDGQQRWTELTREAALQIPTTPFDVGALANTNQYRADRPVECLPASTNCLVAMMLDHQVISAPQVLDVIQGNAQITGLADQQEATYLASVLHFEPLPLRVEVESIEDA